MHILRFDPTTVHPPALRRVHMAAHVMRDDVGLATADENEEAARVRAEDASVGTTSTEVFTSYQPSHASVPGGPHPGDVAEAASLAATATPPCDYSLPAILVDDGRVSNLQLETVQLAATRHLRVVPGAAGTAGMRCGFFLGDGAGVGKGRQLYASQKPRPSPSTRTRTHACHATLLGEHAAHRSTKSENGPRLTRTRVPRARLTAGDRAAIILDQLARGRGKHVWFSSSADLRTDAERDLRDLGCFVAVHDGCQTLDKGSKGLGLGKEMQAGVLFSTYSTLVSATTAQRSRGGSRLSQLVAWCGGPSFEGCLCFDECHKAKNWTGKEETSSKVAQAVLELQRLLPLARVVYCSATGASDLSNMAYMERLALWGPLSAFPDFDSFVRARTEGDALSPPTAITYPAHAHRLRSLPTQPRLAHNLPGHRSSGRPPDPSAPALSTGRVRRRRE